MLRSLLCLVAAVGAVQTAFADDLSSSPGNTPYTFVIQFPPDEYLTYTSLGVVGEPNNTVFAERKSNRQNNFNRTNFTSQLTQKVNCRDGVFYAKAPCFVDGTLYLRWDQFTNILANGYCQGPFYGPNTVEVIVSTKENPQDDRNYPESILCFGKASATVTPESILELIEKKSAPSADLVTRLTALEQAILLAIGRCPEHRDWPLNPRTGNCCDPNAAPKEEGCP
jgi:hypothetical protein